MGRNFRFGTNLSYYQWKERGKRGALGGGHRAVVRKCFAQADVCPEVKVAHWRSPASYRNAPGLAPHPAHGISCGKQGKRDLSQTLWWIQKGKEPECSFHYIPSAGNLSFHPDTKGQEDTHLIPSVSMEEREVEHHFRLHTAISIHSSAGEEEWVSWLLNFEEGAECAKLNAIRILSTCWNSLLSL